MRHRVKEVSKKYINSNGEVVILKKFLGQVNKYYLLDEEGNKLTPIVDSIRYNKNEELFLISQTYSDVYNDGRDSTYNDIVSFYIDFSGNPVSLGYSIFLNQYYPVSFKDLDAPANDKWFTEFGVSLREFGLRLGEELDKRRNNSKILKKQ